MAFIERTAYPRFSRVFTRCELENAFTPTVDEVLVARMNTRNSSGLFCFLTLLKCFQRLHYFPSLKEIPKPITDHIRACVGFAPDLPLSCDQARTLYRYHHAIRDHLGVKAFQSSKPARHIAVREGYKAALVMDQQSDILNAIMEQLVLADYELPAFGTLQRIAERVHAVEQRRVFGKVFQDTSVEQAEGLDKLLLPESQQRFTAFQSIKDLPKRSTLSHLEVLLDHLDWLESIGADDSLLKDIPPPKVRAFAFQAKVLDASDLKDFAAPKRYTLLLSLIHQMKMRTRDDIGEMFIKRVGAIEKRAKEELAEIQLAQRERVEKLATALDDVLDFVDCDLSDTEAGQQLRALLGMGGKMAKLRADCAAVKASGQDNYLPLLCKHYRSHRKVLFRLARVLKLEATGQDRALLDALAIATADPSSFEFVASG